MDAISNNFPTFDKIAHAADTLRNIAHHTPVLTSRQANELSGSEIFFKCENFQKTGSFKVRGAYYAISQLSKSDRDKGIIAYSPGNHAQAVALASKLLGTSANILMPSDAPAVKLAATRDYGANVILYDRNTESREELSDTLIKKHGWTLIPPFDHYDVITGQGTVAKELFEEVGELDYLFVPVGGGGLISGCAIAAAQLSPHCQVIGVEPENANDAQLSFRKKEIVTIPPPNTIADGARTQNIGKLVLPILLSHVKDIITVSDDQLYKQMRFFAERMKIVVEPTGCLAAAAVLNKTLDVHNKKIGVIVSGGNVDLKMFG